MSYFVDVLLDLLFPSRCCLCGHIIPPECRGLCQRCSSELPFYNGEGSLPENVDLCYPALDYDGAVKKAIQDYKFHGKISYCRAFAGIISKIINDNSLECDIITWVPLSKARKRERGYDQAKLIASLVSGITGVPCVRLLKKTKHTPPQSGTANASERRSNVRGVYKAVNADRIIDRRIILIDDVITTGSTVSECAGVLRAAGAESITALSVARPIFKQDS